MGLRDLLSWVWGAPPMQSAAPRTKTGNQIRDALVPKRATQYVEGASSLQLVCPHCGAVQTETVIMVFGGDKTYTCEKTYKGSGCGRRFTGPV
jgi:lysyl-tRNA synthetase class I